MGSTTVALHGLCAVDESTGQVMGYPIRVHVETGEVLLLTRGGGVFTFEAMDHKGNLAIEPMPLPIMAGVTARPRSGGEESPGSTAEGGGAQDGREVGTETRGVTWGSAFGEAADRRGQTPGVTCRTCGERITLVTDGHAMAWYDNEGAAGVEDGLGKPGHLHEPLELVETPFDPVGEAVERGGLVHHHPLGMPKGQELRAHLLNVHKVDTQEMGSWREAHRALHETMPRSVSAVPTATPGFSARRGLGTERGTMVSPAEREAILTVLRYVEDIDPALWEAMPDWAQGERDMRS